MNVTVTDEMLNECGRLMVGHLEDANRWTRKRMTDKKQLALAAYHGARETLEALGIRVVCVIPDCYCTGLEIGDLRFPVREEG